MTDAFRDTMKELFQEAPPDLAEGFKRKMGFIQERYKHSQKTVQSCLDGMADPPSLAELLAAAYLINGGILFKYEDDEEVKTDTVDQVDDLEFSELIKEMDGIGFPDETKRD
jgi:hypothetical protein